MMESHMFLTTLSIIFLLVVSQTSCQSQEPKCQASCTAGYTRCDTCPTGTAACVATMLICDGTSECADGSDERNCTQAQCGPTEFTCTNGQCVSLDSQCDGTADCMDASDETDFRCIEHSCGGNRYPCTATGACIGITNVCDGRRDCLHGNDETESCSSINCNRLNCEFECQPTPQGGECYCRPGYQVNSTSNPQRLCIDIDECNSNEIHCEHFCTNTEGSYSCACTHLYTLADDGVSCISSLQGQGSARVPVVAMRGQISRISPSGQYEKMVDTVGSETVAIYYPSDSDPLNYRVYWMDNSSTLNTMNITGQTNSAVTTFPVKQNYNRVVSMAVDWNTGNVFMVQNARRSRFKFFGSVFLLYQNYGQVIAMNPSTRAQKTVVGLGLISPTDIAIDANRPYMFLTEVVGSTNSRILRYNLDGSYRRVLIDTKLQRPSGIALDPINRRIYWTDKSRDTVESSDYEGRGRITLFNGGHNIPHPYDITLNGKHLYVSDDTMQAVLKINVLDPRNDLVMLNQTANSRLNLYQIDFASVERQPQYVSSSVWCGGIWKCEHLCVSYYSASTGYSAQCGCADGYVAEGTSLVSPNCTKTDTRHTYLLYNYLDSIHGMFLARPYIASDGLGIQEAIEPIYDESHLTLVSIEADTNHNLIYFSDQTYGEVKMHNVTSGETTLMATLNGQIGSLALDNLNNWLYAADFEYSRIYAIRTIKNAAGGYDVVPLLSAPGIDSLTVNPYKGYLFWSTGYFRRIMRSNADGSDIRALITTNHADAAGIAVDVVRDRLYFVDPAFDLVHDCNLDGNDCYRINNFTSPLSIAVHQQSGDIFVGGRHNVTRGQLIPGSGRGQYRWYKFIEFDASYGLSSQLKVFDKRDQVPDTAGLHPCARLSDCSDYCYGAWDEDGGMLSRRCGCPQGQSLSGNTQCVANASAVLPSRCGRFECPTQDGLPGRCLSSGEVCDGVNDCPNGEEEGGCPPTSTCNSTDFTCANGQCIIASWECDRWDDCGDNSDELNCASCSGTQFTCDNGNCITGSFLCDTDNDCGDASDESPTVCAPVTCNGTDIQCDNNQCVTADKVCNGQNECYDGTDEVDCTSLNCPTFYLPCLDNTDCYYSFFQCDNDCDCNDCSDENACGGGGGGSTAACNNGEFHCNITDLCIPASWECDGETDCDDGTDEHSGCSSDCGDGFFTCGNGACIPESWECDAWDDCGDNSDEANCGDDDFTCPIFQYQCDNAKSSTPCLDYALVCDGNADCREGDDEGFRCNEDSCRTDNGGCSDYCMQTPHGAWCECDNGYTITEADPKNCIDDDECTREHTCSQVCINTVGSFRCRCANGYDLTMPIGTCTAQSQYGSTMMFVAEKTAISYIDMTQGVRLETALSWPGDVYINAVEGDSTSQLLYYVDQISSKIMRASYNGSDNKPLFSSGLGTVEDLALDWTSDLLYWTDYTFETINVGTTDGQFRSVLFGNNITNPRSIALDNRASFRMIWWSDWGKQPRIERSGQDGSGRVTIVGDGLYWPNALTLDVYKKRVYFVDAKLDFIDMCDYDGANRKRLIENRDTVDHPWHIDIFEDYIYWVDRGRSIIERCNKFNCSDPRHYAAANTDHNDILNIAIVSPVKQLVSSSASSPCSQRPCEHLCLPSKAGSSGYMCRCATGYKVKSDNSSACVKETSDFLIISRGNTILGQPLNSSDEHFDSIVPIVINQTDYTMFDYDSREGYIYWIALNHTRRAHINGSASEDFVPHLTSGPEAFVIDYLARNIYYADWATNSIEVMKLDGPDYFRTKILGYTGNETGVGRVFSMTLDLLRGKLYWIDRGGQDVPQKIASCNLDGTEARVLWNQNLQHADEITVDIPGNRIFWSNAGMRSLEMLDLSVPGASPVNVISRTANISHPVGLAYYMSRLYYTDNDIKILASVEAKENSTDYKTIRFGITDLHQIRVYDADRHTDSGSPCETHSCDQLCVATSGNQQRCLCGDGFKLSNGKCEVYNGSFIVATFGNEIHGYSPDINEASEAMQYFGSQGDPTADVHVALNVKDRLIYWTDQDTESPSYGINVYNITSRDSSSIAGDALGGVTVSGVAFDWISGYVYFANHLNERSYVEVMKDVGSDSRLRTILYQTLTERPHQLALDPINSYIYWTDVGSYPKIVKSYLDMSSPTTIVSEGIVSPQSLHVDISAQKVYWGDLSSGIIWSINSDGTDRTLIRFTPYPSGLFVFNARLFWCDSQTKNIQSVPIGSPTGDATLVKGQLLGLNDIKIFDADAQPQVVSPCQTNNGGCEQLCFVYPGNTVPMCKCAVGKLKSDNRTCEKPTEYIIYASDSGIHSLSLYGDLAAPLPSIFNNGTNTLDIDYARNKIYYTEKNPNRIVSTDWTVGSKPTILNLTNEDLNYFGITYDWINNKIYYSLLSPPYGIYSMNTDGSSVAKIRSGVAYDIAVHPCERYLFMSYQTIGRSNLAGSDYLTIVSDSVFVHGITIDWTEDKLYYVDYIQEILTRVNFDGTGSSQVMSNLMFPHRLAVYGDLVYWSDVYFGALYKADKYTGEDRVTLYENRYAAGSTIYDVKVHDNTQSTCNASSQCDFNGGSGCCSRDASCHSHDSGAPVCVCPPDYSLVNNGQQCILTSLNPGCPDSQFTCGDGRCIPWAWRCDSEADCADSSDEDETFCKCNPCQMDEYVCQSGQCIPSNYACDKIADCLDGSDENDQCVYPGCSIASDFQCGDLSCVANHSRCDGIPDCLDHSDEMNCPDVTCRTGYAPCATYPLCIHRFFLCNGQQDCVDGSDESVTHCQAHTCQPHDISCDDRCLPQQWHCDGECDCNDCSDEPTDDGCTHPNRTCYGNQFLCDNGRCVTRTWLCDGDNDCGDFSDESHDLPSCQNISARTCETDQFSCTTEREEGKFFCLPNFAVCDRKCDCGGCEDEQQNCPDVTCAEGFWKCADAPVCIPESFKCDYENDCKDGSDELNCAEKTCLKNAGYFECTTGAGCFPHSYLCDGIIDCDDRSDEDSALCTPVSPHCDNGQFRCADDSCVDYTKVCNDQRDCPDGSDELRCNVNECLNRTISGCQQICSNTQTSYTCSCRPGYKLNKADNKTCLNVDECRDEPGSCDQFCYDRTPPVNFTCRCDEENGWYLDSDRKTCKPNQVDEPYLVVANKYYIRTMDMSGGDFNILTQNHYGATYMNIHIPNRQIYYSDYAKGTIDRVNIDGTGREVLVNHTINQVRGIALDWVGDKLYWTDWLIEQIYVSELNGTNRKTFINKDDNISHPFALASDSINRYLYWTDVGLHGYIAKIGFDGTNRQTIIDTRIVWPISLAVDINTRRVWWADGHLNYIGYVKDDGSERRIIEAGTTTFVHALDVFEKFVYWTDADKKTIERANRFHGGNSTVLRQTLQYPYDIRVWHALKQPVPNGIDECMVNNGGCSHLCLLSPDGGRKCQCPDSFILLADNKTCEAQCLSSQFRCGRSDDKCIPRAWFCDGESDCKDHSDEPETCPPVTCSTSQYQCDNSNCTFLWELCDGNDDCGDNSDERLCEDCNIFQFRCSDGSGCIPLGWQCDGDNDCADNSDEERCDEQTCSKEQFTCDNGGCIPNTWICDFDNDCGDNSDEDSRHSCETRSCANGWFDCTNNYRCIPSWQVCDGQDDCRDNSDEQEENCVACHPQGDFTCSTGNQCIRASYRCDFDFDCFDGSDEADCDGLRRNCSESEFRCSSGWCIPGAWKCDFDNDCGDLSDEQNCAVTTCPENTWKCASGHCIDSRFRCDKTRHCRDSSDEINCPDVQCDEDEFQCDNSLCIPSAFRCDGDNDCLDRSDERLSFCATETCPEDRFHCDNRLCISKSQTCDSIDNCGDGSDEADRLCNAPAECDPDTQFKCDNDRCISIEYVCDRVDDCGDNSDEGCRQESCAVNNGGCSHTCVDLEDNRGIICTCPIGSEIDTTDRQNCVDTNECLSWNANNCTQHCENIKGSYKCRCEADFTSEYYNGQLICKAPDSSVYKHFISLGSEIRMFVPNQQKQAYRDVQHTGGSMGVMAIDPGYSTSYPLLYWADLTAQTVSRALIPSDLAEQGQPQVILKSLSRVQGLSYDWINDVLYLTQGGVNAKILAATFKPCVYTKTVYQRQPDEPGLIVVNPVIGYFYVVFKNYGRPTTIERVSLDGRNSTVLVDEAEAFSPTGLTVDYLKDHRVFWCDGKTNTIWTMDKDGGDISRIIADSNLGSPLGLEAFEGFLYFLSENNGTLMKMPMFDPRKSDTLIVGLPRTNDLKMFHEARLPTKATHPSCDSLACDNMCLGSFEGAQCVCPDYDDPYTNACDPPCSLPPDRSESSCLCKNGGSCVTNPLTAAVECSCISGFEGDLCQVAVKSAVTAAPVKSPDRASNIVIPIVVILALIVIIGAIVLFVLYKKRGGKALFTRSGGAEFRSGDHDDPGVRYAPGESVGTTGAVYMDSNVDPYYASSTPAAAAEPVEPSFDNPIYAGVNETASEPAAGTEDMNEISEIKVEENVPPPAESSSSA